MPAIVAALFCKSSMVSNSGMMLTSSAGVGPGRSRPASLSSSASSSRSETPSVFEMMQLGRAAAP
jgi:hypothetical protein